MFKNLLLTFFLIFSSFIAIYPSKKENTNLSNYCYSFEKILSRNALEKNKNVEPIFWLFPKIKNPEPKIRHIIAPTRRIDEIGTGNPFDEIYSTVLSKSFIFPGMAEINIAEIDNLEKKSKKDLMLLFFQKEFFIILV